ncbi:MAG: C4-dicarboxylate ABC transporter, partial [Pararhodobacter sp.]
MIRKTLLSTGAVLAMITASPALAQDAPVELRFAVWVGAMHPLMVGGTADWIESIQEASGGTITVTVYPSEQLGRATDHYDLARDGIADMSFVNPGYNAGRFPVISYGEIPFRF